MRHRSPNHSPFSEAPQTCCCSTVALLQRFPRHEVSILPILQPTHRTQALVLDPQDWSGGAGVFAGQSLLWLDDRQELLADAKSAIWQALSGHNAPPPPKSRRQVSEELQPFRWALYVALLYSLWDMISKVTRGFA
eukprot:g20834.t1